MADDPSPAAATAPAKGEAGAEGGKEEHAEGLVEMTPARIATADLQTEVVAAGTLGTEILAQATVSAPPEGRAALTARADGAVTRIFKRLGDAVSVGETVAIIESRGAEPRTPAVCRTDHRAAVSGGGAVGRKRRRRRS